MNITLKDGIDPKAFASVERTAFPIPWPASHFSDEPGRFACSLWDGETCACFVYGNQVLDEVELWRIATHTAYTRQGLARRVYHGFSEVAKKQGAERIFLEVAATNTSAIKFYDQMGFAQDGLRKAYYQNGDDALLMSHPLSKTNSHH